MSAIINVEHMPTEIHTSANAARACIEKADKALGKYNDYIDTAKSQLVSLRDLCKSTKSADGKKISFVKVLASYGIGKSRAYEILAIADGKISAEEVAAKNAQRQRKYKERLKSGQQDEQPADSEDEKGSKKSASNGKSNLGAFDLDDFMDAASTAYEGKSKAQFMKWLQDEMVYLCNAFDVPR